MSARLDEILRAEMARWESAGLRRDVDAAAHVEVPRERELTSNDYLSLARDERLVEAAREAIERHGVGARAARLLGGGSELDRRAETMCAEWLGTEDALLFPSGYQANVGVVTALAGRGDAIVSDELVHASLVDGARLSRAHVHVHRHLDVEHVEHCLRAARGARRRIVLAESVYGMDGDLAPLAELHEACARHDAWLVVDEAHAVGLVGERGSGAWSIFVNEIDRDRDSRLAARVLTGGKALGVTGGFVVGSRVLRDHLANRARSFVFTTGVSPAVSGALCAAIEIARSRRALAARAVGHAQRIAEALGRPAPAAAIVPFVVGDSARALELSRELLAATLDVRAVRPPTVPEGGARLRIACHAHNDDRAIDDLVARLKPTRRAQQLELTLQRPAARVVCVVGTDTGIGKTVVSALLARAISRVGRATYWKPVQTGSDDDTAEVARLAGSRVATAEPLHRFPLPASPHTAATAAGARIDFDSLRARFASLRRECDGSLVVELAGGLLVPYDDEHVQADLVALERPEIVLVARSGLGTLNHTLLTVEALAARGLAPRALFLVGEPHAANAATLRARTAIAHVFELPRLDAVAAPALDEWIDRNDVAGALR